MKNKRPVLIVDIDQTLVDSSIRENFCYDNDKLILPVYQKQKFDPVHGIHTDSLLPLGQWLEDNCNDFDFVLLTARFFDFEDYNVLGRLMPNILSNAHIVINRNNAHLFGGDGNEQASAPYKYHCLKWLGDFFQNRPFVVIDDCEKVLDMAKQQGHLNVNARDYWTLSATQCGSLLMYELGLNE